MLKSPYMVACVLSASSLFHAATGLADVTPFNAEPTPAELAARAFEVVENQVRAATTQPETAWASQPGALRTFGDGELSRIYKLYSAPDLLAASAEEAEADLAFDWDQRDHHFVDLNTPSLQGGELRFPIADPRSDAEGFAYADEINGVVLIATPNENDRRLPMPVRWLYLLEDGTCGYLDGDNRFIGSALATEDNPIVGRIAFWTDDLSCKINVNTASEGSYWDIPRFDSPLEHSFAESQPAAGEFQRHPGHPATVCLSSVLFPGESIDRGLSLDEADFLWRIGNGIGTGGSRNGTVGNDDIEAVEAEPLAYQPYDSPAEILARPEVADDVSSTMRRRVRRGGFFLTTASNSPDTTSAGLPRVSLWPAPASFLRSDFDDVAVKMAELRFGNDIYFIRDNARARHGDLYVYSGRHNLEIFEYLDRLAQPADHLFAGNFAGKYGAGDFGDIRGILAGVFNHVRSTNLDDPTAPSPYAQNGQTATVCLCGGSAGGIHNARWDNTELPFAFFRGRNYTVTELALVFHCTRTTATHKHIKAALVAETFCPSHGFGLLTPTQSLRIAGDTNLQINGQSLGNLNGVATVVSDSATTAPGGAGGLDHFHRGSQRSLEWGNAIEIPIGDPTMVFTGNAEVMRFELHGNANPSASDGVQLIEVRFPSATLPVPTHPSPKGWSQRLLEAGSALDELLIDGDVVRSVLVPHGDYRLTAATRAMPEGVFQPHFRYATGDRQAHALQLSNGEFARGAMVERQFLPGADLPSDLTPDMAFSPDSPNFAPGLADNYPFSIDPRFSGDFDNGFALSPDGPYVNRSDDGVQLREGTPYFDTGRSAFDSVRQNFHAPHRMVPSPVTLGSIPSGARAGVPWRTLLFRPDPHHFGASGRPDHRWLDLFRMPTPLPERRIPRAPIFISEPKGDPVSADGKINLNFAMLPFHHLHRSTALHAMFKPERVIAIPTAAAPVYKRGGGRADWRHRIDPEETLEQWQDKFADGDIFRAASEICEMYLVPEGETLSSRSNGNYPFMELFWSRHRLTGDNTKERPYAALYQNATTRSNAFEIHIVSQTISKSGASSPDVFDPDSDELGFEFQTKQVLTRSLPRFVNLPNYTTDPDPVSIEHLYEYSEFDSERQLTPRGLPSIESIELAANGDVLITYLAQVPGTHELQRSTNLTDWESLDSREPSQLPTEDHFLDQDDVDSDEVYYRIVHRP